MLKSDNFTERKQNRYSVYVMGWITEEPGFDFRQGREFTLPSTASIPALRPTQPPIQWAPAAISQELKRPGREYGQSFPTGAYPRLLGAVLH
jgi:hypothetical protein